GPGTSAGGGLLGGRPAGSRSGRGYPPRHGREGARAPRRSAQCLRFGRGRTGSLVLRRNFRRGGLQSRADVLPRAGTGPLGVSSGASSARAVAVSVDTVPERSYNHQINVILTRYVPGLAEAVTRTFSLGEASRLEELFREGGFSQIETGIVKHTFVLPSFDAYYGPFERGGASTGQALAALPDEIRRAVPAEGRPDFAAPTAP